MDLRGIWGHAWSFLAATRRVSWTDLLLVAAVVGLLFGAVELAHTWTGPLRRTVEIDLSPWSLARYSLYSLSRGLLAYGLSLVFSLTYGYWAAKDRLAERVLVPLLDILQSIPVLGFMPGLVLALVAAFPASNVGLELAAVLMIFTGQVWNMTFSFYHSVRSVPHDLSEAGTVFRFSWWQRFRWIEGPFAVIGLVWNSMMSMAGGWFFLMINEAFRLGERDFRLPGIGSYMSVAVERGRIDAMLWAVAAMVAMIVGLDQLLWRPAVAWSQKFRMEEGGQQEEATSWLLDWIRRSRLLAWIGDLLRGVLRRSERPRGSQASLPAPRAGLAWPDMFARALFAGLLVLLGVGVWQLAGLLRGVVWTQWMRLIGQAGLTLARVLASTAIGTLWALPAGLAIGRSPRLSRVLQPVVQVVASFPAPMLFPLVIAGLAFAHVPLGWGSILLMLLGTQWYVLFNVIAGAMAIPADLNEVARSFGLPRRLRFVVLYLPAVFPYLVTGWVTAAGGAWNASIVAEYVHFHGQARTTTGLGATISQAASDANLPLLAAAVLVMSSVVVLFNRVVWRQLYRLAESRFGCTR
jgi:NitT/TauT family transport system permease protein